MCLGVGWVAYKKPLGQSDGDLVFQVVCLPAGFNIGGGPLLLQPFCPAVEDVEYGSSGSLYGVRAAGELADPQRTPSRQDRVHSLVRDALSLHFRGAAIARNADWSVNGRQ